MTALDYEYLSLAARLALRGHGGAEPNPLVGCVIVSPDEGGTIIGWGYHARCGGPHAEINALERAGERAVGATVYVTLEPCNHEGRTGPCTEALIRAGVKRVVIAREDPNPLAAGGIARLREAGIEVERAHCEPAVVVSDPFVHRLTTGLPWLIVKWAQSIDGKVATRSGESQWISSPASRLLVHRERARVDAILTGIGTVLSDDPLLTARRCGRIRRIARRIVIDTQLETPLQSRLVASAQDVPLTIVCDQAESESTRAAALRAAGAELLGFPSDGGFLNLTAVLRDLASRHTLTNILVEAGPGLMSALMQAHLVNEAWVFIAPFLMGDDRAVSCLTGAIIDRLSDAPRMKLVDYRRKGDDMMMRFRVISAGHTLRT